MKHASYKEFGYNSNGIYTAKKDNARNTISNYLDKLKLKHKLKYKAFDKRKNNVYYYDLVISSIKLAIMINSNYKYNNEYETSKREFIESKGYKCLYLKYPDISNNSFKSKIIEFI